MKTHIIILTLVVVTLLTGCEKEEEATPDEGGGGGNIPKATLSNWSVPNGAWGISLISGNISNSQFLGQFVFSDMSVTNCDVRFNGTDSSGTYISTNCTADGLSGSMSNLTDPTIFQTGGTGSYLNDGTTLSLCRASTTCIDYN